MTHHACRSPAPGAMGGGLRMPHRGGGAAPTVKTKHFSRQETLCAFP
ncbi:MAG: hypothetical protein RI907_2563 [Pseudomonadota bacterium]